MDHIILEVKNLKKYFPLKSGILHKSCGEVRANDDVSLTIKKGETYGLVGESGSGKSTFGRTVLRLLDPSSGTIYLKGINITSLTYKELKNIKREIQMIFQDPYSSLNPRMTIEQIIGEPLLAHKIFKSKNIDYDLYIKEIMETCGLSYKYRNRYPHQFSGGQRQRIGIARALVLKPSFIVCDEPVSALDVSIQSQIINLFIKLQKILKISYLFISHDLSVVKHISHKIGVMYLGKIVEEAPKKDFFENPLHPYSKALLAAVPDVGRGGIEKKIFLKGEMPSNIKPPVGCAFYTRCPIACEKCKLEAPIFRKVDKDHYVSCHYV